MNDTAGLKCEPDDCIKIQIRTIKPVPVAMVLPNKINMLCSERFWPIIPEPTTIINRKQVPVNSLSNSLSFGIFN